MPTIEQLDVSVFVVPTEQPESDGTLTWRSTCVVVVEATAEGERGTGFTYATPACARFIADLLGDVVVGREALDVEGAWSAMVRALRNQGRPGVASMSVAAIDCALWDLKARILGVSLGTLLGVVRDAVPAYGSGGFTSLSDAELEEQLSHWIEDDGFTSVKIKVGENWGSNFERDLQRTAFARKIIGPDVELFVDANGGYQSKQAVRAANEFAELGVIWFEEPVSSDHLRELADIRAVTPIDVAAGEYGYDLFYFEAMCQARAVDCLQADVSRCAGISEWVRVAALAESHGLDLSGHCAQSMHVHPASSVTNLRHVEYFADHARVDRLLFDGVIDPHQGLLRPESSTPGNGLTLKSADAKEFRVA